MEIPVEFVELLRSHAEITILDNLAHKRFILHFRSKGADAKLFTWLPLTLEPGQKVVRSSTTLVKISEDSVLLGVAGAPYGAEIRVEFETVETLHPEQGLFRVETFNAAEGTAFARLIRRTATVRIESSLKVAGAFSPTHPVAVARENDRRTTLRLDVAGDATLGRFRFYYALGEGMPSLPTPVPPVVLLQGHGDETPGDSREILEPRRSRLRRRASLRRLP